jgi:hypothetical protein
MFLTAEDLEQLTGYKKPKLQRDWLIKNGFASTCAQTGGRRFWRARW